ncbi:MAG: aromatic ring-opening dioxygenase subunit LigA [Steroidobacteraceae bacterium]
MSLYQLQKFLFDINRDPNLQRRFLADRGAVLADYQLTAEERDAIVAGDIGLIYVLGANGQLLMHYAALLGMEWSAYIGAMREGVRRYGPVRAGLYAMTTRLDEKVANV